MITFIAVMVFINFILLCVNEFAGERRAKHTIFVMRRLKSESDQMINDLRREIEELRSS